MDEYEVPRGESLRDEELDAVVRDVQAFLDEDVAFLREIGAYEQGGDPYIWTHHWRLWDHVDLIRPPGDPRTWVLGVYRGDDNRWAGVDVEMWTKQEGRSELVMEIDLMTDVDGAPKVLFRGLHVM